MSLSLELLGISVTFSRSAICVRKGLRLSVAVLVELELRLESMGRGASPLMLRL